MRHAFLMAGISVLAITGPALAQSSIPLHRSDAAAAGMRLSQVQIQAPPGTVVTTPGSSPAAATAAPGTGPASTTVVVTAPAAPPPSRAENPHPPPGPDYVWKSGSYVIPPPTMARWTPGYWQQGPDGWVWVPGSWGTEPPGR